ncbi:MAG: radical SAM protein, partial [Betaproteobacteria bacterium]
MSLELRGYTEFTNRLHGRVGKQRIPLDVSIEVTRRCPLQCAHCYNNLPMADREARSRELSREEHFRLLDELAAAGSLWVLFTGGEIFARADFLDIYLYAKRKGFLVTLFTNGTLITKRIADTLAEYRPFSIEITLYGRTREAYERLTGVPGSYDRCLDGIRLLRERGLPLFLKTVAVSINRNEIPGMKRFVEEELGLPFKFDAMMTPRIDCSASPLEVRLRPEEVVELDLADP